MYGSTQQARYQAAQIEVMIEVTAKLGQVALQIFGPQSMISAM
jgi:hypothetical protein